MLWIIIQAKNIDGINIMLVNMSIIIPFIDQCFCLMAKYAHNSAGREKKEISNSDMPTG